MKRNWLWNALGVLSKSLKKFFFFTQTPRAVQDENIMRKKYHNMMEDMKGKIRVFARVRPVLKFETQRGATNALLIPDVLTLQHMWKDKKREYNFDSVFDPNTSQETVCMSSSSCFSYSFQPQICLRKLSLTVLCVLVILPCPLQHYKIVPQTSSKASFNSCP